MNLYEHTIIARQDTSPSEIRLLTEKYAKIVEKNNGEIIKTENWGLFNLSYLIKKNKKGSYIHFKIKGDGKMIGELEKNEAIDKKLLRYLTIKVKKFDLNTNYFGSKKEDIEKKKVEIKKVSKVILLSLVFFNQINISSKSLVLFQLKVHH